ncbi:hypothetical protein D3C80_661720 [compost metagenome]
MIKDKVNTHFSKEFNGFVWKIMVDEKKDMLALEIRNAELKTTSFTCININNQQVTINNLQLEESWFCGMEIISDGVLLLHYYINESSPEHKGMIAFDACSGKMLWENYTHAYSGEKWNAFIAYNTRIEPKRFVYLDKTTGQVVQPIPDDEKASSQNSFFTFPELVDAKVYESYLSPHTPEGIVELAQTDNTTIISFYIKDNQVVTNYIRVFNNMNELVLEDKMLSDIQNQGSDTFFVYKKCLLYIKNRSKIVGYFL